MTSLEIHQRKAAIIRQLIPGLVTATLTFLAGLALTYSIAHPYRAVMETVLKEDLRVMRRAIDQYAADRGELPRSLDDLIQRSYIYEVPTYPLTGKREWKEIEGETEIEGRMSKGIIEVRSNAKGSGRDGKRYSEYRSKGRLTTACTGAATKGSHGIHQLPVAAR